MSEPGPWQALPVSPVMDPDPIQHRSTRAWARRSHLHMALRRAALRRAFRVTLASFKTRALLTVEALRFGRVASFEAARDARPFDVLIRVEGH
jgi:hypothetical protein